MKAIKIFQNMEKEFIQKHPDSHKSSEKLIGRMVDPRTADADSIWRILWEKPLYSNTKVGTGSSWEKRLEPYMQKFSWKQWGVSGKDGILIEKIGKGLAHKSYALRTPLANEIRNETNIALYRLFAIQGAAKSLQKRSQLNKKAPYSDLNATSDLNEMLRSLKDEFGTGWGILLFAIFLPTWGLHASLIFT